MASHTVGVAEDKVGGAAPTAQETPPVKVTPIPGFDPLFFGRDPSSRAKRKKYKNEQHRQSKVGGGGGRNSQSFQVGGGKLPPLPSPPASAHGLRYRVGRVGHVPSNIFTFEHYTYGRCM